MAATEGVEGIPVLFVAWNQPDVFRLGTSFKFQTLVRNCLECQRKYSILQLKSILTLHKWLTSHGKLSRGKHFLGLAQPPCHPSFYFVFSSDFFSKFYSQNQVADKAFFTSSFLCSGPCLVLAFRSRLRRKVRLQSKGLGCQKLRAQGACAGDEAVFIPFVGLVFRKRITRPGGALMRQKVLIQQDISHPFSMRQLAIKSFLSATFPSVAFQRLLAQNCIAQAGPVPKQEMDGNGLSQLCFAQTEARASVSPPRGPVPRMRGKRLRAEPLISL